MLIALDGPAASGKGTIGKMLSEKYGIPYLDTGKLYRAVAWLADKNNLNIENEQEVLEIANSLDLSQVEGADLHSETVGKIASITSSYPLVRKALLGVQQDFAASVKGAILDGRDIGTVICPNADFKFYITGKVESRAQRRYKQLQNKDYSVIYQAILDDLKARDERDSKREASPLVPASDAIVIDTTDLGVQQVFDKIIAVIEQSA